MQLNNKELLKARSLFGGKPGGSGGVQPDLAQNDPTAPDYVKNRTHYEVEEFVNAPLNITWDGNTEGKVSVENYYKVSDVVLTNETILSAIITQKNGNKWSFTDNYQSWDAVVADGWATEDCVEFDSMVFYVRKDGVTFHSYTFPEKGIYVRINGNDYDVANLTTVDAVEHTTKVPKPLDKKFIPDEVIYIPEDILYAGAFAGADIKHIEGVPYAMSEDGVVLCFADKTIDEFANFYERNVTVAVYPKAKVACHSVGKTMLAKAVLPNVETVWDRAFRDCVKLQEIVLPKATSLGESAFDNCQTLKTVDLPKATSLGYKCFSTCYQLTALILRSKTRCSIVNGTFSANYHLTGTKESTHNPNGDKDGYIYVPSALINSYKTATYWKSFASQFRALEDYTVDGTITGALDETKI
jgi:hypothetical protein